MFTSAPAAPTLSTTTSPASPTSPTRSGRLRGLSYLRTYTHNHLHSSSSSDSRPSFPRGRSQPSPTSEVRPSRSRHRDSEAVASPSPRRSAAEASGSPAGASVESTSGWLPGSGRTALSRVTTRQQATEAGPSDRSRTTTLTTPSGRSSKANPTASMTRNRAESAAAAFRGVNGAVDGQFEEAEPSAARSAQGLPTVRLIPHYDPRAPRPSLAFSTLTRTLPTYESVLRVGRYSERENRQETSTMTVGFKSKVVSRRHCELWCQDSQWYIKDVKSSSGTFLNHIRLSQPGVESKPFPLNDGDIVQLGIDFRGGEEMIFRCVKIRIECNRSWQKGLNKFNKSTHNKLRNLGKAAQDAETASTHTSECSICLMSIAPCQSLFVAPCSHVWHYKCIRPILNGSTWPNFLCPNCRAVADLEADVDEPPEFEDLDEAIEESMHEMRKSRDDTDGKTGDARPALPAIPGIPSSAVGTTSAARVLSVRNQDDTADLAALMADANVQDDDDGGLATPDEEDEYDDDAVDEHDLDDVDGTHIGDTTTISSTVAVPIPIAPTSRSPLPIAVTSAAAMEERAGNASTPHVDPARPQSSTPPNVTQYALAVGEQAVREGPMTPRNDEGPFVLDGSGNRTRRVGGATESLDQAAAVAASPTRGDSSDGTQSS